jgi:hypothetical protein
LGFMASGDLLGQFGAESFELTLGSLELASLSLWDIRFGASPSESNTAHCVAPPASPASAIP